MSSIKIHDLAHAAELDSQTMAAVRGGSSWGPGVNVNVTLDQRIAQFQNVGVNVLNNNGMIGAGFVGPTVGVSPTQWAMNKAVLPGLPA